MTNLDNAIQVLREYRNEGNPSAAALVERYRFVTVEWRPSQGDYFVTGHADTDAAIKYLESEALSEGWRPLALVDLDTGDRRSFTVEVKVSV